MICDRDFPRGEVLVKVGVMEFWRKKVYSALPDSLARFGKNGKMGKREKRKEARQAVRRFHSRVKILTAVLR